jgi:hypothetical protein
MEGMKKIEIPSFFDFFFHRTNTIFLSFRLYLKIKKKFQFQRKDQQKKLIKSNIY